MLRYPRKHRTKLIYPAGLLSLAILPLLCTWYIAQSTHTTERALGLITYSEPRTYMDSVGNYYSIDYKIHPDRNFIDINLSDNKYKNSINLAYAALKIYDLREKNDTINGVHFIFSKSAKYSYFVKAIEISKININNTTNTYVLLDNNIWVFNYVPKPIIVKENKEHIFEPKLCGALCGSPHNIYIESEEQKYEKAAEKIAALSYSLPSGIILLSMFLLVLFNKQKHFNN